MVSRTLAHYKILEKIGSGRMGEVYLAEDTELDRKIALKVLPPDLAESEERRARFRREAKALAALNHPNIVTVFSVEEAEGVHFITMELVRGKTLSELIPKRGLPLNKFFEITIPLADAVSAAHQQEVIHRDLKPANLMQDVEGRLKILDFGLAKWRQELGGAGISELPTQLRTQEGLIVGTMAYMSPEQAEGKTIDQRSDNFSLGVILYELATGERPFRGDSPAAVLSSILRHDPPPVSELAPTKPRQLARIIRKCLAKEPSRRYQTALDIRSDLEALREEVSSGDLESSEAPTARLGERGRRIRERIAWALSAFFVASSLAVVGYFSRDRVDREGLIRFQLERPGPETVGWGGIPAVSPDGKSVAFTGQEEAGSQVLWIRALDSLAARALPGTEGATRPFWSPEGNFIGFFAGGKLKKIAANGGPTETIGDAGDLGGTWNRDGDIVFSNGNRFPLYRISAEGGVSEPITTLDTSRGENSHRHPQFLPDGRHFLYLARSSQPEHTAIYVGSLDSNDVKRVMTAQTNAFYSPPGYLLFVREGALKAQPFDADKHLPSGTAHLVAEGLSYTATSASARFGVSANGRVLTFVEGSTTNRQLAWFDRKGDLLGRVGPSGEYIQPRVSPDGKRIAVSQPDPTTGNRDLWLMEVSQGIPSRFTLDASNDWCPVWSPDGREVLFSSDPEGVSCLFTKDASGADDSKLLYCTDSPMFVQDWSSDGRLVVYTTGDDRLFLWSIEGEEDPESIVPPGFRGGAAEFSPDANWIAYTSDESGQWEVWVRSIPLRSKGVAPSSAGKWQVSSNGGTDPRWRRDGGELFYLAPDNSLMAVETGRAGTFVPTAPKVLFRSRATGTAWAGARQIYDVAADGERFLIVTQAAEAAKSRLTVVVNWAAGLEP
jgi:serine/threonine protein kinase/Tol biopolymer transport system component